MKLKKLIENLEKAREIYLDKHGVEPSVFSFDSDEGLLLCSGIKKNGGLRTAKKPYIEVESTGLEEIV